MIVTNSFVVCSSLIIEVFSRGVSKSFKVLNVYGPYGEKRVFWKRTFNLAVLQGPNLIIGGDLKFNLNFGEIWGDSTQVDPLVDFFNYE